MIGLTVLLFALNPVAAGLAILIPICIGIPFYKYSKTPPQLGESRQLHEGQRIKLLDQSFGSIKTVKLFGKEQELLLRFGNQNRKYMDSSGNTTSWHSSRVLFELMAIVVLAVIVSLLLLADYSGSELIPIAGVFAMVALRLTPSANRILGSLQNIRFGAATVMPSNNI